MSRLLCLGQAHLRLPALSASVRIFSDFVPLFPRRAIIPPLIGLKGGGDGRRDCRDPPQPRCAEAHPGRSFPHGRAPRDSLPPLRRRARRIKAWRAGQEVNRAFTHPAPPSLSRRAAAAASGRVRCAAADHRAGARHRRTLPPQRPCKAKPKPAILRNGVGTGIVMPRALPAARQGALPGTVYFFPQAGAAGSGPDDSGKKINCPQHPLLGFPLLDPLRAFFRRRRPAHSAVPRICFPGLVAPFRVPVRRPPSPDDPIDATRLGQRLAALASALDDLPGEARRFARWRARNERLRDQGLVRRVWPLRPGRPPGIRRPGSGRRTGQVDEILAHAHALAVWALEHPDTS